MRKVFEDYHYLFALEDLELGKTSLVKHIIKLDDPKPFREHYRRILLTNMTKLKSILKRWLK